MTGEGSLCDVPALGCISNGGQRGYLFPSLPRPSGKNFEAKLALEAIRSTLPSIRSGLG